MWITKFRGYDVKVCNTDEQKWVPIIENDPRGPVETIGNAMRAAIQAAFEMSEVHGTKELITEHDEFSMRKAFMFANSVI